MRAADFIRWQFTFGATASQALPGEVQERAGLVFVAGHVSVDMQNMLDIK